MPATRVAIAVPDTTAYTVLASNTGLYHYVPDVTSSITITLPAPAAGLWFVFSYAGVSADAQDWVITTGSATNFYLGGLVHCDNDGDTVAPIAGNGTNQYILTVVKPAPGTVVKVESLAGVTWVLSGMVGSQTVPSFA